jgi:membrane-associated protease RseP (regulator of RpoE activity)
VVQVWSDPSLLLLGVSFSAPAMFILLCHELGHYIACRRYHLPATLPYFLPFPLALGTLGAFIKIRAPIRTKRELFDVGVAGPIAGFVALLPFLVLGVLWSEKVSASQIPPGVEGTVLIPGHSLALAGLSRLVHGPLGDQQILQLHPFALAAWFGLLATSLNLIPLGQLDGGHILYAAVGRAQFRIAPFLWAGLALIAFLVWPGWGLWCVVTLVMGLRHPPVYDEALRLDPVRRRLAWVALVIFLLSFMPLPIGQAVIRPVRRDLPVHTVRTEAPAPAPAAPSG